MIEHPAGITWQRLNNHESVVTFRHRPEWDYDFGGLANMLGAQRATLNSGLQNGVYPQFGGGGALDGLFGFLGF